MKKRIISFFLVLVMLFSCLSLNIFATEGTQQSDAEAAVGTVVSDTLDAHTDDEILALIKANEKFAKRVWLNGKTTTGVALTSDGEKLVKNKGNVETRLDVSSHTSLSGRDNLLANLPTNRDYLGQSFVVQLDFVLSQEFLDLTSGERPLVQINNYAAKRSNTLKHSALQTNIVVVKNGFLQARRGADTKYPNGDYNNAAPVFDTLVQLKANTEYTLSVFVDPKGGNAEDGVYGTYNVYLNGELICENQSLFCEIENNIMTMPEDVPFFYDGAWNGTIDANNIVSYFFTDTLPTEEEFNAIIAESNLSFTPLYANAKAIGTVKGAKDFANGFVRLFQNTVNYTQDNVYSLDNIMVYYADSFVGTLVDHSIKNSHKHDFAQSTTEVTYFCELCDGEKVVIKSLDANGDRVCDVCVSDLETGAALTPAELITKLGSNSVIFSHDMTGLEAPNDKTTNNGTTIPGVNGDSNTQFLTSNPYGNISMVTDESGNTYIKNGASIHSTALFNDTNYVQVKNLKADDQGELAKLINNGDTTLLGAPYVISYDYMRLTDIATGDMLQVASYIRTNKDDKVVNLSFINLAANGELRYFDGSDGVNKWISSGVVLPKGEFKNITIVHTPKTNSYDLIVGGVRVAKDVTALNAANLSICTGTLAWPSESDTAVVDGATQFTPGFIRFKPTNKYTDYDTYAIDNIKVYLSADNVECIHDYELSHTHGLDNGMNDVSYVCKHCDKTYEKEIVMTDFSVFDRTGNTLSVSELKALLGSDVKFATDFTNAGGSLYGLHGGANKDNGTMMYLVNDGDNSYLKFGAAQTTADTYKVYGQYNMTGTSTYNDFRYIPTMNFDDLKGKAYVISNDFMIPSGSPLTSNYLFNVMSYATGTNGCTQLCPNSVSNWSPIRFTNSNGTLTLTYVDGSTIKTLTTLEYDKFYTVAVHHTPKGDATSPVNTYDIYFNNEMVVENAVALNSTEAGKHVYTSGKITISGKDYYVTSTGAQDYIPGAIQSVQPSKLTADAIAFDNIKAYYSDNYVECTHKYTDSTACDWCGKEVKITHCDICDGEAISENAAIVGRSVSLTDAIALNAKLVVTDGKDATVTMECGDRTATFNTAEETAEDGIYTISLPLRSTQMADDVLVYAGEDKANAYTTSIVDYVTALIAENPDGAAVPLAKAMLNYGAAAQVYFSGRNGNGDLTEKLANASLSSDDKTLAAIPTAVLTAHAFMQKGNTENVAFTGAALQMSSRTHMKLYFKASENATVTVDGVKYKPTYENGEYYITISAANPAAALNDLPRTVEITDGDVTVVAPVTVFTAVVEGINATGSGNFYDLLTAYAWYCQCAATYAGN